MIGHVDDTVRTGPSPRYEDGTIVSFLDNRDSLATGKVHRSYLQGLDWWYEVWVNYDLRSEDPVYYKCAETNLDEAKRIEKGAMGVRPGGDLHRVRENLTTNVIELLTSLQSAIIEAGGTPQVLDPKMTIGELFTILAPNKIRFYLDSSKGDKR